MTDLETRDQVALAQRIAFEAHEGQVDKLGEPYIDHPRRVAERLQDPVEQAAGWLHDVLEDNQAWTANLLRKEGIDTEVIEAVQLLTRSEDVSPDDYCARIKADPVALAVKLADLADNLDPVRRARIEPAKRRELGLKYVHALEALDAPVPESLRAELEPGGTQ